MTEPEVVYTVASGDLRRGANVTWWPTQAKLEDDFAAAVQALGWSVRRGHAVDEKAGHGLIDSQRAGTALPRAWRGALTARRGAAGTGGAAL